MIAIAFYFWISIDNLNLEATRRKKRIGIGAEVGTWGIFSFMQIIMCRKGKFPFRGQSTT